MLTRHTPVCSVGETGDCSVAIGQGMAFGTVGSIFQCGVFVSGLWGIRHEEMEGPLPIALFFTFSAILIAGIFLQADQFD